MACLEEVDDEAGAVGGGQSATAGRCCPAAPELYELHPIPSPDGRWVAGSNPNGGEQFIFDTRDWRQAPEQLSQPPGRGTTYLWDWSPDGTKNATRDTLGQLRVFNVATKTWDTAWTGIFPRWLPDGVRLVAQDRRRMTLVDTIAKTSRQLYAQPDRGRAIFSIALAPDARGVYFTSAVSEADIWLMRFGDRAGRHSTSTTARHLLLRPSHDSVDRT